MQEELSYTQQCYFNVIVSNNYTELHCHIISIFKHEMIRQILEENKGYRYVLNYVTVILQDCIKSCTTKTWTLL